MHFHAIVRSLAEQRNAAPAAVIIKLPPANTRRYAAWTRPIRKIYEIDSLECVDCGSNLRIIALDDDVDVVGRILKHPKAWDPQPDCITPAGPDPPLPQGETTPLN